MGSCAMIRLGLLLLFWLAVSGCVSRWQPPPTIDFQAMPEGVVSPRSMVPAGLLIHNKSTHNLEVHWIDYDGGRRPQTRIAAGKSGIIGARVGHAFVIETEGRFVRLAFANYPTEELTLNDSDFVQEDRYRELRIEGWPIRLDKTLSSEQAEAVEAYLREKLAAVLRYMPAKHHKPLQSVPIWVDKDAEDRGQYHPGIYWMEKSGWHVEKYMAIHFGRADRLLQYGKTQPMVVLHELSHAFHDQVLGFDDERITKAYLNAREQKLYDEVKHINGRSVRAYAMKDEREYFAELTEAYFGTNDYFPFTRDELRSHDPMGYRMVEAIWEVKRPQPAFEILSVSESVAKEYGLDRAFYRKTLMVQDILIASSDRVSDYALYEAAYQFDAIMRNLAPAVAQRIRERKPLCILVAHDELTSQVPQFSTDKTGKELDFYNWRKRGFLTKQKGRHIVFFAEEDVLEYPGGMDKESILIHEFGHVVHGVGFDREMQERLTATFENAKKSGLWNDGFASQRFGRVDSETPTSLLDALAKAFPHQTREFLKARLGSGDVLVNQQPTTGDVQVTKADKVRIVFGGPKACYAIKNRSEYWAEVLQCWYDTNRTMDHDHNHIRTREQLQAYDPMAAALCADVLGNSPWRFQSPRERAGQGHLTGFDPSQSPKRVELPHIREAALDYYDEYWKDFWSRLHEKYGFMPDSP